jgi:hypothetical protein
MVVVMIREVAVVTTVATTYCSHAFAPCRGTSTAPAMAMPSKGFIGFKKSHNPWAWARPSQASWV